jgi:hypothetical protein
MSHLSGSTSARSWPTRAAVEAEGAVSDLNVVAWGAGEPLPPIDTGAILRCT